MTITEKEYLQQINALREMSVEDYESNVDALIKELEAVGLFDKYDNLLLAIDNSFDEDFSKQLTEQLTEMKELQGQNKR